jgi:hypothetical protein
MPITRPVKPPATSVDRYRPSSSASGSPSSSERARRPGPPARMPSSSSPAEAGRTTRSPLPLGVGSRGYAPGVRRVPSRDRGGPRPGGPGDPVRGEAHGAQVVAHRLGSEGMPDRRGRVPFQHGTGRCRGGTAQGCAAGIRRMSVPGEPAATPAAPRRESLRRRVERRTKRTKLSGAMANVTKAAVGTTDLRPRSRDHARCSTLDRGTTVARTQECATRLPPNGLSAPALTHHASVPPPLSTSLNGSLTRSVTSSTGHRITLRLR